MTWNNDKQVTFDLIDMGLRAFLKQGVISKETYDNFTKDTYNYSIKKDS